MDNLQNNYLLLLSDTRNMCIIVAIVYRKQNIHCVTYGDI